VAPRFEAGGLRAEPRKALHSREARRTNGIRPSPFHAHEDSARNAKTYGSGGHSGPCAHLRALESRRGSSLQLVQTYRGRPSEASSGTAFIGLRHAGQRLPDRMEHGHLFPPCDGTLVQPTSGAQAAR
jgi:hypothetical protein